MTHATQKINAVILHRGTDEARFPVNEGDDVGRFIADMILCGFRAGPVGAEVHLYGPCELTKPPLPFYKPIRSAADLKGNRWELPVPASPVPVSPPVPRISDVVPSISAVVPNSAKVVSLAQFRDRRRPNGTCPVLNQSASVSNSDEGAV